MKNNLKQIRESQGLEQTDVARDLEIPVSTYRSYEQGTRGLNGEKLIMFARYFKVSTDTILGSQFSTLNKSVPLTLEEAQLIKDFRALEFSGRKLVLELVGNLASREQKNEQQN